MSTTPFVLDLRDEFSSVPLIPAVITCVDDDDDLLRIEAEFPNHPELKAIGPWSIALHGENQSIMSISYWESTPGMHDALPTAGAIKGLFRALMETHRPDIEMFRLERLDSLGISSPDHSTDREEGFMGQVTVYVRYRFFKDSDSCLGDLHYGHRVVHAVNDLPSAIDRVMSEERSSLTGDSGDNGEIQFVYATNGVDPNKGLHVWQCGEDQN